jgi:hypothetical protein
VSVFYRGACPQAYPVTWRAEIPSSSAARSQGLCDGGPAAGAGAVSIRNCSTAATIAAAAGADAALETSSILGRGGLRRPLPALIAAEI